jgi:hypothetical protein
MVARFLGTGDTDKVFASPGEDNAVNLNANPAYSTSLSR